MNLYINKLTNQYCLEIKERVSFEITPNESPYYDIDDMENEELVCRPEYVDACTEAVCEIWKNCEFSEELIVLYEDKYNHHHKGEKEFIESCMKSLDCIAFPFEWSDEGETYKGKRYIWETTEINSNKLFRKIILSDMGDDTELDCAVYIIDKRTGNVFFLYDDRGVDVFSDDSRFIEKMESRQFNL